jgi:hypothetical protein
VSISAQGKSRWRIRNRLQSSYEYDSNIREIPLDSLKLADSSVRLLFNTRISRTSPASRLFFSYQGGLQTYFQHSIENKLINEASASASSLYRKFEFGIRGYGRAKFYLKDVFDYLTGSGEIFMRLPPKNRWANEVAFRLNNMRYRNFPLYDYSDLRFRWILSKAFVSKLTGRLDLGYRQIEYHRPAIRSNPEGTDVEFLADFQQDDNFTGALQLLYSRKFLANLTYTLQYNNSNSFGYTYFRHQVVLILGVPLPGRVWFRGYGALQIKNYAEDSLPFFPIDLDTERGDSNFFILDLSRDMTSDLSLFFRFALYNNESIIRSLFYKKTLLTTGIDFRF